jgi:hypothetical protein
MNTIDLYSVPVFVADLAHNEKFTRDEVEFLKSLKLEKQYGSDGNYLSDESHVLKHSSMSRIHQVCDRYVKNYTENILGITDEFRMFRSWLSMNTQGTRHLPHSHRNTMISCILYFDEFLSDQPLAPISFGQSGLDQVFKNFQFQFNVRQRNQYNNGSLTIFPKTNTIIVFPGWIQHETEEAKSTVKRYCLGTNYFFVGESASGYHHINIDIK